MTTELATTGMPGRLMALPSEMRMTPAPMSPATIIEMATILYRGGAGKAANPSELAVRIMAGLEVGLRPVQACNNIMLVNGRATIWGDAALALVRASGLLLSVRETIEGTGDSRVAVCITHRKCDAEPVETRFSVADAKTAGLWAGGSLAKTAPGKVADLPWVKYPERMMRMRARSWNLRDQFGDVMCGLGITEEAQDIPTVTTATETVQQVAAPEPIKLATPPAVTAGGVSQATVEAIVSARYGWLRSHGIDGKDDAQAPAVAIVWAAKLAEYGVTSARQLTEAAALELLADLEAVAHGQEVAELFAESPAETPTPSGAA